MHACMHVCNINYVVLYDVFLGRKLEGLGPWGDGFSSPLSRAESLASSPGSIAIIEPGTQSLTLLIAGINFGEFSEKHQNRQF